MPASSSEYHDEIVGKFVAGQGGWHNNMQCNACTGYTIEYTMHSVHALLNNIACTSDTEHLASALPLHSTSS